MDKWVRLCQLLDYLRGYNAAAPVDRRVPAHYIDALASVLGDKPVAPSIRSAELEREVEEYQQILEKES